MKNMVKFFVFPIFVQKVNRSYSITVTSIVII